VGIEIGLIPEENSLYEFMGRGFLGSDPRPCPKFFSLAVKIV